MELGKTTLLSLCKFRALVCRLKGQEMLVWAEIENADVLALT